MNTNEKAKRRLRLFKFLRIVGKFHAAFPLLEQLIKIPGLAPLLFKPAYKNFFSGEDVESAMEVSKNLEKMGVLSMIDYAIEHTENPEEWVITYETVQNIIKKAGAISYWNNIGSIVGIPLKISGMTSPLLLEKVSKNEPLSTEENFLWNNLKERLERICLNAQEKNLKVFIDAEESWIQPAIDELTLYLMEKLNQRNATVFGTIQFYRKDSIEILSKYLQKARTGGFKCGIKAVRGAYHDKEISHAKKIKQEPVVFLKKEETDRAFNRAIEIALSNLEFMELNIASHNEHSINYAINLMKERNIPLRQGNVTFAQLYGMADYITLSVIEKGALTCKYIPFGEIKRALKYLIRRAKENSESPAMIEKEIVNLRERGVAL